MWRVQQIDLVPVRLDFTSSGQGRPSATAVVSEGIKLVNALEFVDVESNLAQVEVCECCGFSHCSPGGWVAFRQLGECVAWFPVWSGLEHTPWEAGEYSPPCYVQKSGAPLLSAVIWDRLREVNQRLPPAHALPSLTTRELIRLLQSSAPGQVLGTYPGTPHIHRDLLLAVTEGELMIEADAVDGCLQEHVTHDLPVAPLIDNPEVRPIEFWLDLPGTPAWTGFARHGDEVIFLLDGSLPLRPRGN